VHVSLLVTLAAGNWIFSVW